MSLSGVEIIANGSGSYMELRKAYITTDLIRNASYKAGGAYLFSNLRGCDGQRVYFNGGSAIALNGEILAYGKQFSLHDVVSLFWYISYFITAKMVCQWYSAIFFQIICKFYLMKTKNVEWEYRQ